MIDFSWQDVVLGVGQALFVVALIPTILGKEKPALLTSLMTGSVLAVFTFVFFTLGLWLGMVSSFLTSLSWFILAVQKLKKDRNNVVE